MLLRLQRNRPDGEAIHGKLFIDGTYFCDTLERTGVQIPALWYTVTVTMSPRFKRLLPIVERVPNRTGIRFHVGTKPSHSSGCILVPSRELENQLVKKLQSTIHHPQSTIPRFYKDCTIGFWLLLLLTFGRIAFRIAKAIYLHR